MAKAKTKFDENVVAAHQGLEDLFEKGSRHHSTLKQRIETLEENKQELEMKISDLELKLDAKEKAWEEKYEHATSVLMAENLDLKKTIRKVSGIILKEE